MTRTPPLINAANDDELIRDAVKRMAAQAERVRLLKSLTATDGQLQLAEELLHTMQRTVRAMYLSRWAFQRYVQASRANGRTAQDDAR